MSRPPKPVKSYSSIWSYALFGGFFGLIFPVISWMLVLQRDGLTVNFANIIEVHKSNLVLYMTDLAPIVLGLCFAIIGKFMRNQLNYLASVSELERSLRDKDHNDEQKYSLRNIRVTYVRVFLSAGLFMLVGLAVVLLEQEDVRSAADLQIQINEFERTEALKMISGLNTMTNEAMAKKEWLIQEAKRMGVDNTDSLRMADKSQTSEMDFAHKLDQKLSVHALDEARNSSLIYAILVLLVISILVYTHFFIFAPNFILAQKAVLTNTISRNLIKKQAEELLSAQQEKQVSLTQLQLNLKAALEVDRSLDPPIPDEVKHQFGWFSVEKPLQILSGDFIWYRKLDNYKSIWVLGDSVGHGVGGHLQAKLYKRFIDEITQTTQDPMQLLVEMDKRVKKLNEHGSEFSCEMVVLSIDFHAKSGSYASAGMALCKLNSTITELPYLRESIGNLTDIEHCATQHFQFDDSDYLLACTDGLKNTFNSAGKRLGTKGLKELILNSKDKDPRIFSEKIETNFEKYRRDSVLNDDSTLLGISLIHKCPNATT